MRRRTLEEKLEAIRLVEEGNSPRSVSDRLHKWYKQHRNESLTCPQTLTVLTLQGRTRTQVSEDFIYLPSLIILNNSSM